MRIKKIPYKEFVKIYSKVTRLCVEVVLKTDKGLVLTKRNIEPYKGLWHLPGGTVLYNESIVGALKRVAMEELGVNIKVLRLLDYLEYPEEQKIRGFGWSIGFAFLCEKTGGVLRGSEQGEEVKIFQEKLPLHMVKQHKKIIRDLQII